MSSNSPSTAAPSLVVDTIKVGDSFGSAQELRTASERVLLSQGRTLVSDARVNGGKQKVYRCSAAIMKKGVKGIAGGCPVFVRAYKRADKEFHVVDCLFEHSNCAGGKKKPSLRAMSSEGAVIVNANRKITSGGLVKTLKGSYGVELTPHTANRLKRQVVGVTEATQNEGYQRLESYLDILTRNSPGTVTHCEWDAEGHFVSAFIMLGGVAHFATQGVQQVASMDFAHLKGDFNGTMGTISTKSANNNVVHLATCLVAKETGDAYRYMINQAVKHPEVRRFLNKPTTTIFTDNHKGSDSAIPDKLVQAEHLRCAEHMLKNHGAVGPEGRMAFYSAARAPEQATCEFYLNKVTALNAVAGQKIADIPRHTWAMYATRGNVVWDQVTSNISETNHMITADTRAKPALDLIQDIVMQSSARLATAANLGNPTDTFCPFATKTFNAELEWAKTCEVSPTGGGGYMVFPNNSRRHYNVVKLVFSNDPTVQHVYSCTCGWCSRWLIPCRHVIAAAKANDEHERALDLLDDGYRLENFRAAASDDRYHMVPPVWSALAVNPNHQAPLPVEGQAGRKKGVRITKRKRSNGEFATSSRTYALHVSNSQAQAEVKPSLSQGLSQDPPQGDVM